MVYLIQDADESSRFMVVKAENEEELRSYLKIKGSQTIVGRMTDADVTVLYSAGFAVISA